MEATEYTEKLIEHFQNPRNVGRIPRPDGVGVIGDPSCGDYLRIYIKVKDDRLFRIKFEVYGCPAAIATTSILTEMALGRTLEEAQKIRPQDVAGALGGLSAVKMHCSNLGTAALYQAIALYQQQR
ncbi:MAG: iron-sulfur cluster assembly scaffold protein [Firmicutes bacterium]|nr:iron-sulfur cluster assembly scaffold protein [Bacillota bacterium]